MKCSTDPKDLSALEELLTRSTATAGRAVGESVAWPERQMNASELVAFWQEAKVLAMTTVGSAGQPHTAPVHARLLGARVGLVIYDHTLRRQDLVTNPRVSFCTWGDHGEVVLLYGRAHEIPGSLREARATQAGDSRNVVEIDVELTRVYAMLGKARESSDPQPS
jgi:hypothetical protein